MGGGEKKIKAQAAIELAVFGAVLIFVIGAIIKQSLAVGYWQNQNLKAMRLALKASYESQMAGDIASRRMASVLFVEDRLTADSAKYGAIDRTPHMVQGSGAHNRNLFMPVDFGDCEDLPVMDVIVNGKRFVFTMAGFRKITITPPATNADGGTTSPGTYPVTTDQASASITDSCGGADSRTASVEWDPYCAFRTVTSPCTPLPSECSGGGIIPISCDINDYCSPICPGWISKDNPSNCGVQCTDSIDCASWCPNGPTCAVQCDETTGCPSYCPGFSDDPPCSVTTGLDLTTTGSDYVGCANFYTIIDNHPLIDGWCDDVVTTCGSVTADERFDLDRGLTNLNRGGIPTPAVATDDRPYFAWQWYLVRGVIGNRLNEDILDANGNLIGNTTHYTIEKGGVINIKGDDKNSNTSVDVDRDLAMEDIDTETDTTAINAMPTIITRLDVVDSNEGDVDFSGSEENSIKPLPGFTKDTRMYTFVRDRASGGSGTYFRVEEGKLFSPTGNQFIRTARKKDQIDLIERVFQLSNDTGRYCDSSGNLVTWGSTPATKGEGMAGLSNPVEVCNNCFTTANISRTCMDTANLLIFIRSNIEDLHGRKWVTDTSGDPYVNFMSPAGY